MAMHRFMSILAASLFFGVCVGGPAAELTFFPAVTQFSPVPSGKGWKGGEGPLDEATIRDTIDNIRAHGFTGIEAPTHRPANEEAIILRYAQDQGMIVSYHAGALELFGRTDPPDPCIYSPEYAKAVRANAEKALAPLKSIPRLYNVFAYQDEPFHWGPKSFGYTDGIKAEFKKRYGYDLPPDIESIRNDPKKWLDVINFRSDGFPDGWRQVYPIAKELAGNAKITLTHDSHNTFGAGFSSHSELAIDDVGHWGGDFADLFVFDIYPYMMFDFRFGRPAQLPKPRISQTHYAFAQMRALTQAYKKDLGFWVGTYNPAWFAAYLCPELAAMRWSEREMSMTAVASGANYLLTGYQIPVDAGHWDTFGDGLRLLQKAGARILDAPKVRAKACMLFPRTQLIQLQQEYFNVGLSYELFLRSFGELDVLHEDQVTDDKLGGYDILVLFDVELLPEKVANHIAAFVKNGGTVIADCVPRSNELREPSQTLEAIFGVKGQGADRIRRSGHWVPNKTSPPGWQCRDDKTPDESVFSKDEWKDAAMGQEIALTLVSPRPCVVTTGQVLAKTVSGQPVLVRNEVGKGRAYVLGFCVQDTYFRAWEDEDPDARDQLGELVDAVTSDAEVNAHVRSSNPDIEASVRANTREAFLFVINHESEEPETTVRLRDLPFPIGRVVDMANDQEISTTTESQGARDIELSVDRGGVRLLNITPETVPAP